MNLSCKASAAAPLIFEREFQLKDTAGTQIGTHSVRITYAGGAGIGGAGFLDMDDLAKKLGVAAAESLTGWAKTGKFDEK